MIIIIIMMIMIMIMIKHVNAALITNTLNILREPGGHAGYILTESDPAAQILAGAVNLQGKCQSIEQREMGPIACARVAGVNSSRPSQS